MAESKRPEGSVWAAVTARCGRRYIGYYIESTGELHNALELSTGFMQANPNPQPVFVMRCAPVDGCLDTLTLRITDPALCIDLDKDVSDDDRQRYTDAWDQSGNELQKARMARSGIAIPTTPGATRGIIRP